VVIFIGGRNAGRHDINRARRWLFCADEGHSAQAGCVNVSILVMPGRGSTGEGSQDQIRLRDTKTVERLSRGRHVWLRACPDLGKFCSHLPPISSPLNRLINLFRLLMCH
jgi:hypothetical protein